MVIYRLNFFCRLLFSFNKGSKCLTIINFFCKDSGFYSNFNFNNLRSSRLIFIFSDRNKV